ncbi:MAG TPA: metallopeptidase TldD-related protein, partial [Rhodocyclaceae bacterium]|nr:metallopeptidase TldD-related protein [Rhodocyclaceae bacterium]
GGLPVLRAGAQAPQLYVPNDPLASLPADAKVKLLERLEGFARAADPRVVQVMASLGGEYEVIRVAGLDGRVAADIRPLVRVSISVIIEENGKREQGSSGGGGRFDYGYFSDEILERYAREAVHQASVNLGAKPAPAGQMTVVLGNGWPGILLHEAIGHGLEGDFNRKGSSAFSGRIGQRVAAPGVTVVDDGTIADRRGSLNIDDEGNPTQRTVLIED